MIVAFAYPTPGKRGPRLAKAPAAFVESSPLAEAVIEGSLSGSLMRQINLLGRAFRFE